MTTVTGDADRKIDLRDFRARHKEMVARTVTMFRSSVKRRRRLIRNLINAELGGFGKRVLPESVVLPEYLPNR